MARYRTKPVKPEEVDALFNPDAAQYHVLHKAADGTTSVVTWKQAEFEQKFEPVPKRTRVRKPRVHQLVGTN